MKWPAVPALSSLATKFKQWIGSGDEGSWRGPFYGVGHLGNLFQLGSLEDGYQRDLRLGYGAACIPAVAAIQHLHRSAFAQLRPSQKKLYASGQIEDVADSTALRCMLRPNAYESGADFNGRLAETWVTQGEVLVWGARNGRDEVAELHIVPRGAWQLLVDPETSTVFYGVSRSTGLIRTMGDVQMIVPQRDIIHLRWATPRHPLIGETGFAAAGIQAGVNVALSRSQAVFFQNMRRPSGVLSTDLVLNKDQTARLREAYDEQSKLMQMGGLPILGGGMKFQPIAMTSEDSEVIAALRMSNEEIARCVGVPPPLIGDLEKSGLQNTEALIAHWLSISLGGLIERYERALEGIFELNGRTDWIDMGTEALLRVDFKGRMDALTKGVQGGVLTPNDARRIEGLSPVEGGNSAFMQRQNTPIELLTSLALADLNKATAPAPDPALAQDAQDTGSGSGSDAGSDTTDGGDGGDTVDSTDVQESVGQQVAAVIRAAAESFRPAPVPVPVVKEPEQPDPQVVGQAMALAVATRHKRAAA